MREVFSILFVGKDLSVLQIRVCLLIFIECKGKFLLNSIGYKEKIYSENMHLK